MADRLAVSPNGRTLLVPLNLADATAVVDGLVSHEGPGTVSVISLRSATKLRDIQAGASLSRPEGIALNPRSHRWRWP